MNQAIGSFKAYYAEREISLKCFYSLFERRYESDYSFSGESHNFWEMVYVCEGAVCVSADDRIFHLKKGQVIFHKPMEFHKFHIEDGEPATLLISSFHAEGTLTERFENCVLELTSSQKRDLAEICRLLKQEGLLLDCTDKEELRKLVSDPALFQRVVCMLELWLLSLAKEGVSVSEMPDTPETIAYRSAIRVMENRMDEWLSVEDIAKECAVSVSFLKKVFTKYAGLGIHQYFLKIKVGTASRMLREGKSVSETAAALAFSSPNYFSTVYKRETGISPFSYQKQEG